MKYIKNVNFYSRDGVTVLDTIIVTRLTTPKQLEEKMWEKWEKEEYPHLPEFMDVMEWLSNPLA